MKKTRISFLLGIILLVVSLSITGCGDNKATNSNEKGGGSDSNTKLLRLATGISQESALGKTWGNFAKKAEEYSNGKLKVEVYYSGSLFSEVSAVEAIKNGTIDIATASNQNYGSVTDSFTLLEMPFIAKDDESFRKLLDGEIGQEIRDKAEKTAQLKTLAMVNNGGFRPLFFTSDKIVKVPADLKGKKMRITSSPIEAKLFKSWGASTVIMNTAETFTSLQTNAIDGHAFNWTWAYSLQHFSLLKSATLVNYSINASIATMDLKHFNSLSKDIQDALIKAGKDTEVYSVKVDGEEVQKAMDEAKNKGVKIYQLTNEETKEWMSANNEVYQEFSSGIPMEKINQAKKIGGTLIEPLE